MNQENSDFRDKINFDPKEYKRNLRASYKEYSDLIDKKKKYDHIISTLERDKLLSVYFNKLKGKKRKIVDSNEKSYYKWFLERKK